MNAACPPASDDEGETVNERRHGPIGHALIGASRKRVIARAKQPEGTSKGCVASASAIK